MNLSKFFIDRPIFAGVLSLLIFLAGLIALRGLPISEYPEVVPPSVVVRATYPGANPKVIAETVATPLEEAINGVEGMLYMSSQATTDGLMTLTVTFRLGTDPDKAQQLVQNRVSQAEPRLPEEVRRHIAAGKQCTRLAMTWESKISFVLTESLAIKSIKPLDVLKDWTTARVAKDRATVLPSGFTDEEFALCPPIVAMGGDGAMLDIGFQNLSRLMASGKPIRVMVLDTQVYSNTGGQASTATYLGQQADMSPYGKAQHGKQEVRKELSLIAMAHRSTFVLQSSQAAASHLMAGVLKGLHARRPALFNIYAPCPVEHGLPDEWAPHAAKLALESRAFPLLVYDPDAGESLAEQLSLDGNPAVEDRWPTYALEYVDDDGQPARMELPVTIADWAATEGRFKKHFHPLKSDDADEALIAFHELLELPEEEREGRRPFIYALDREKKLTRLAVSGEMVALAEERLRHWGLLREMAGLQVPDAVRDRVSAQMEAEFDARMEALRAEHEQKMAELRATYPVVIARRLAEGLIRSGNGTSFACPNMAGLATCLWQGFPEVNNMRIIQALRQASSRKGEVTGDGSDDAIVQLETGGSGGCARWLVVELARAGAAGRPAVHRLAVRALRGPHLGGLQGGHPRPRRVGLPRHEGRPGAGA